MRNATATKNVALPPARFLLEQGQSDVSVCRADLDRGTRLAVWSRGCTVSPGRDRLPGNPRSLPDHGGEAVLPGSFLSGAVRRRRMRPRTLDKSDGRAGYGTPNCVVAVVIIGAAIAMPVVLPVLSERAIHRVSGGAWRGAGVGRATPSGPPATFYADMHGWTDSPQRGRQSDRFADTHRAAELFSISPKLRPAAGAIEWLGRGRELPPVRSGHNNYWLWGPGEGDPRTAIIVGGILGR